jgi:hypothetical protein
MRNILLAASACSTPEMTTVAANTGPQQAEGTRMGQYEPPPPPQLSPPPRKGWAANYRSPPR